MKNKDIIMIEMKVANMSPIAVKIFRFMILLL